MTVALIIAATMLNAVFCAVVCLRLARHRNVEAANVEAANAEAANAEAANVPVAASSSSITITDDPTLTPTQQLYAQYIASAAMDEALHPSAQSAAAPKKPTMPTDKEIAAMLRALSKIKMSKDTAAILAIAGFAGILGVGVGYLAINSQSTRRNRR